MSAVLFSIFKICVFQALRCEVERRLDVIPRIVHEPKLIKEDDVRYILPPGSSYPPYYYRLKAVDDVKTLGKCLLLFHYALLA